MQNKKIKKKSKNSKRIQLKQFSFVILSISLELYAKEQEKAN